MFGDYAKAQPVEVCLKEVWSNGQVFCPPIIPDIDASLEEFEMLRVGH
jgi:hypothetical protein